jgi:signal transduction histidine kinase
MAVQREAPEAAVAALEEAERQGRASLADIRRIVRLLRADDASVASREATPGLEDVQALVEAYRAAGLPVALSMTLERSTPAPVAELALYRVLQEALTNAARHGTGPATVRIEATGQGMALRVTNPAGQRAPRQGRGSGLLGMRERIAAAGGTIATGVEAGQWVVRATIPGEAA